jgi:hypothetical protein
MMLGVDGDPSNPFLLDIERLDHVHAAGAQQLRDLRLIAVAVEL